MTRAPLNGHVHGVVKPSSVVEVMPGRFDFPEAGAARDGLDRVELSEFALHLDRLRAMPDVRLDRVTRVRQAIADGTYDTEDKLDLAIDRLAEEELT